MNKTLLLILILGISVSGRTDVEIDWTMPSASDEVYENDGTTLLTVNSVWQLIWTPDKSISSFNSSNPFLPDSSERLLQEYRNTNAGYIENQGGSYSGGDFGLGSDGLVGGYVYSRFFQYQGSTSSFNLNDLDGMYYDESSVIDGPLADTDNDPGPPGISTLHKPSNGATTIQQQFSVIPEPSTIMLVMIAGLVGVACRRRR